MKNFIRAGKNPVQILAIVAMLLLPADLLYAQDWGEQRGEIEDVEIEIVKERQITLPKANRNFEKIPPRPSEPISPPIRYDFRSFNFQAPQINAPVRPLKLKAENPASVNGGYLRAGYGNYASPLLEAYINSKKDRNKLVGSHLYHNSSAKGPVDGRNSGNGMSTVSLFGKSFNDHVALSGNLDFENRFSHFYGYPEGTIVERSALRQAYSLFKAKGELSNTRSTDFLYSLGAGFNYLADRFNARESEVDLSFRSAYKVNTDVTINLDAAYAVISRKDAEVEAKPRNLFTVTPSVQFAPVEDLKLTVGVTAAFEDDTLGTKNVHVYPHLAASYPVSPSVDFVASLTGGIEKVSLQTLSLQNIWLRPNIPIYHSNRLYDLSVGINGKVGNKVAANAGVSFAAFRNLYFFINDFTNGEQTQSQFDVVYDEGVTQRSNVYGAIRYAQSEKIKLMLRGDYFGYRTDTEAEAWHRPTYKATATASFNIYQKLLLNLDMLAQGGMKARHPVTSDVVTLDGALDLNVKAEYLVSQKFSLFIQGNNLLNNNYPIYLFYPARGLQVIGGFTWTF